MVRGLRRADAEAIFRVVERARAIPLDQCPQLPERGQDPLQVRLISNVLMAVLVDICLRNQVAANLAASSTDVHLLVKARVRGTPPPRDLLLAQGWRGRFLLPKLLDFLEGRRSLRIADPTAETPFACGEAEE